MHAEYTFECKHTISIKKNLNIWNAIISYFDKYDYYIALTLFNRLIFLASTFISICSYKFHVLLTPLGEMDFYIIHIYSLEPNVFLIMMGLSLVL